MQKTVLKIDSSPKIVAAVQPSIDMFCTCLPREVGLLQNKVTAKAMTLDAIQEDLKAALQRCTAEPIRKTTLKLCMADSSNVIVAEGKESFCQCLQAGVSQLSDQEIAQSAQVAHSNFRAKVAARIAGQAEPEPQPHALSNLEMQCKSKNAD